MLQILSPMPHSACIPDPFVTPPRPVIKCENILMCWLVICFLITASDPLARNSTWMRWFQWGKRQTKAVVALRTENELCSTKVISQSLVIQFCDRKCFLQGSIASKVCLQGHEVHWPHRPASWVAETMPSCYRSWGERVVGYCVTYGTRQYFCS